MWPFAVSTAAFYDALLFRLHFIPFCFMLARTYYIDDDDTSDATTF